MGKNHLVYGENTEILYLQNILKVMTLMCGGTGVLLILLGQTVFGCIGLAAVLVIGIIILSESRKEYQKLDGSFLYNGQEVSIHTDAHKKRRKYKPVFLMYGDKKIPLEALEGGRFAKKLTFMLEENLLCVFEIDRKKKSINVKIGEQMIVDNNYVRKDYLLPD